MGYCTVDTIENILKGWVGLSKTDSTHRPIIDIYNNHKPLAQGYSVLYTDAYCATTISAAFIKANAVDCIGATECGVERFVEIAKKHGIWNEDGSIVPKRGYLIVYNWDDDEQPNDGFADHIGFVSSVSDGTIHCIEGNINGGYVANRDVSVGWGCIRGYIMPKYSDKDTVINTKFVIDISEWQDNVDYNKLVGAVDGVILRCSRGTVTDKMFEKHVDGCRNAGIPIYGLYHFIYATSKQEAVANANFAAALVQKYFSPNITIWCDLEYDTIDKAKALGKNIQDYEINEWTIAFCERIESFGFKTGIYTNLDYYRNHYSKKTLSKYPIWLADYSGDPDYACAVHQYSSRGRVNGISGNVDCNHVFEEIAVEPVKVEETKQKVEKCPFYQKEKVYTLQNEMKVRKGPGVNYKRKKHKDLTEDGQKHDVDKNGCLDKGTRVTCFKVSKKNGDVWIQIPSGWVAAYYKGKVYVK